MAVQILGGKARGFSLETPPDNITRPTSVLLRRRLFDWRQRWEGRHFVDLCAGSGAMGFEALSRGAERVVLNDVHRQVFRVLQANQTRWQAKVGLDEGQQLSLSQGTASALYARLAGLIPPAEWGQTVLFFDPPYEQHGLYAQFWEMVKDFPGEVWVESDELKGVLLRDSRVRLGQVVKEVTQGDHWILVGRPRVDGGDVAG